jgi:hypothetical protein
MIAAVLTHAFYTGSLLGIVFLVGRGMQKSMKRKGQHRRAYHGWYVWCWMLLGGFGGLAALPWLIGPAFWTGPPADSSGYAGMFGFGLLGGWAAGMVHGAFMLRHFVEPPTQTDTKAGE